MIYSDPYALYGLASEAYAVYLLDDPTRSAETDGEAFFWFNEAVQMAQLHVTGNITAHTIVMMNNFGRECLRAKK